jgi:hypothetical protein
MQKAKNNEGIPEVGQMPITLQWVNTVLTIQQ